MPKNITLMGASFSDVPAVNLPQTGGGTARFTDTSPTTAGAIDVLNGKVFVDAAGAQNTGSLVVNRYYTGSGTPSSSLGQDGDLYLQVGS